MWLHSLFIVPVTLQLSGWIQEHCLGGNLHLEINENLLQFP